MFGRSVMHCVRELCSGQCSGVSIRCMSIFAVLHIAIRQNIILALNLHHYMNILINYTGKRGYNLYPFRLIIVILKKKQMLALRLIVNGYLLQF